jgi:O-antigen/teichoic acid export membrane protein
MNNTTARIIMDKIGLIFPPSSLRTRITKGVFWSFVGTAIAQGLTLVVSIFVARLLGQTKFGELGIINSTLGMLGVFAGLGLGTTATKYVAEFRTTDPARAGRIIGLSTIAALISGSIIALGFFIVAPWMAAKTLNAPYLTTELRFGCGLLLCNALIGMQIGTLSGLEAFKAVARVSLLRGVLTIPIMLIGTWFFGLTGAVTAMVLVAGLGIWINQRAIQKESQLAHISIIYQGIHAEWGMLWKFSLPALMSGALVGPVTWVANTWLVRGANGYAEMGIFNAANQWRSALIFIPMVIGQVSLPILSSLFGGQYMHSYKKVLWTNLVVVTIISLMISLPIVFLSGQIMSAYGSGFSNSASVLVMLIIAAILSSSASVTGSAISSMGKMWHGFLLNCLWAASFIISTRMQIGQGANRLALAYLLSYVIHFILVTVYVVIALKDLRVIKSDDLIEIH